MFPGGEANFGQATYWSLERPPQVTLDGFDLYSSQASIAWPRVDLTRPLQRQQFRPLIFEFSSSVFTKAAGLVSLAGEGSLVSISGTVLFPQASCVQKDLASRRACKQTISFLSIWSYSRESSSPPLEATLGPRPTLLYTSQPTLNNKQHHCTNYPSLTHTNFTFAKFNDAQVYASQRLVLMHQDDYYVTKGIFLLLMQGPLMTCYIGNPEGNVARKLCDSI